jgi:hypothetical protein
MLRGVYRVEHYLVAQVVGEEGYLCIEYGLKLLWCVYMQRGSSPQQSERGYHADKSETVVAMQMGYKHVAQLGEPHMTAPQLHLCAFGAVEHKHLVAHLNHL